MELSRWCKKGDQGQPEWSLEAKTAFRDLVLGRGPLCSEERDDQLLDLAVSLGDAGLNPKSWRNLTSTLRKFLKHLDEHFELRYLQGLPEIRSRLRWSADDLGGGGVQMAAICLDECLDTVFLETSEALSTGELKERVDRVRELIGALTRVLDGLG